MNEITSTYLTEISELRNDWLTAWHDYFEAQGIKGYAVVKTRNEDIYYLVHFEVCLNAGTDKLAQLAISYFDTTNLANIKYTMPTDYEIKFNELTILELIKLFRTPGYELIVVSEDDPFNEDVIVKRIYINRPCYDKQEAEVSLYTLNESNLRPRNISIYYGTSITYNPNSNKISILNGTERDILVIKPSNKEVSIAQLLG